MTALPPTASDARRDREECRESQAASAERTRLAEVLHDGALQTAMAMLQDCGEAIDGDHKAIQSLRADLQNLVRELRGATTAIHEPSLQETTLSIAVARIVRTHRERGHLGVEVNVSRSADPYNDPAVREAVRELTYNVARHADATSLRVEIAVLGPCLQLIVADDGIGISTEGARLARDEGHIGLGRLARSVARLGGNVAFSRVDPHGTTVAVHFRTASLLTSIAPPAT